MDFQLLNQELQRRVHLIADGGSSIRDQRRALREVILKAGYVEPDDDEIIDTTRNLLSDVRIEFSLSFNLFRLYAYRNWLVEVQKVALIVNPAWELIVLGGSEAKREGWAARWNCVRSSMGSATHATFAYGSGGNGKIGAFAAKTDPIWRELCRFDAPHPPFDFDTDITTGEVACEDAIRMGLVKSDGFQSPPIPVAPPVLFGLDMDLSPYEDELRKLYS